MDLLKPIEDTNESLVLDFSLPTLGILIASAAKDPTGLLAPVISIIVREVFRRVISPLTSQSESKRLYQWGKQAAEGITQRLEDGEKFRTDGFFEKTCTAYGFLDHSLKEDCATITISLKGVSNGEPNEEDSPLSLRPNLFLKSSAVKVPKQKCVVAIISTKINSHNGSSNSLKMRPRCLSLLISSPAMPRSVSPTLSSSLGEWNRSVRHQKKLLTWLD